MLKDSRKKHGRFIASHLQIKRKGSAWIVHSETNNNKYEVRNGLEGWSCNCHDYQNRSLPCKHIHAVDFLLKAKKSGKKLRAKKPSRPTYHRDWSKYNEFQTREKAMVEKLLQDLCRELKQPLQGTGKPRVLLNDLVFSAVMKVYGTFSGRRSSTNLRECQEKSLIKSAPHYNTISKYLNNKEMSDVLKELIKASAKPLAGIEDVFAPDSTGFHTSTFSKWYDEKFNRNARQNDWLKVHLSVGVKTHIVAHVEITSPDCHDTTQFPALIEGTLKNFKLREVVADKAYLSQKNFEIVNKIGGTAYIPFKSNTTGKGTLLWERMYHLFQYKREDFDKHYHQRSNVESAIQMIKSKFREGLRSKNETSQRNELLCKVLCHNLTVVAQSFLELNTSPDFWRDVA